MPQTTPYTVTGTDGHRGFKTQTVPAYNQAFDLAEKERKRLRGALDAMVEIRQHERLIARWHKIGGKFVRVEPDASWFANA